MEKEGLLNYINNSYINNNSNLQGRGLKDTVKALVYGRDDYPPHVRQFIKDNKYKQIKKIKVGKSPIEALTKEKGDILTFGKYSQVLKKNNIDDLYHDWLEIELDDGKKYIIEKNEVISVEELKQKYKNPQYLDVPITNNIRVNNFLKKPLAKKGKDLLKYNVTDNNCQDFVQTVLNESKVNDKKIDEFVKQPTKGIFEEKEFKVPIIVSNVITDIAEKINIIKEGAGRKKISKHNI